ncbi:MAG: hypothetical protein Q4Q58_05450 [Thermoplasmata archaeon]|nr:hypothetical protein [Thermoplasmata archaeon]
MSEESYQRPLLITILGALYVIIGILAIISGYTLYATDAATLIDQGLDPDMADIAGTLGIAMMIAGIVYVIAAAGFFKGWSVMWYLGIVVMAIGAVANLYFVVIGEYFNIIIVLIDLVLLYYIFRPNVKEYFLGHA